MRKYLTVLCCLLVSSSISMAWASSPESTTGQIYLRGALVDPACEMNFTLNEAQYQCYKQNQVYTSTQAIVPASFETSQTIVLPKDMGIAAIRWMDNTQKNGVIDVSYF